MGCRGERDGGFWNKWISTTPIAQSPRTTRPTRYSPRSHPPWTLAIEETKVTSVNDCHGIMFLHKLIQFPEISPDVRDTEDTSRPRVDNAVERVERRLETPVWSLRRRGGRHGLCGC
jgi:hypothetical protein